MTLRANPVEQPAKLPDGRTLVVRIRLANDSYIPRRELDTVAVELVDGDEVAATVNTILRPDQTSEARALAREIAEGLESGSLEPTTAAIEPLADSIPDAGR